MLIITTNMDKTELFTILLFTIHYKLFTINYSLFTLNFSLQTIYDDTMLTICSRKNK